MGIDPGLRHTGWGIVDFTNNQFRHIANGTLNISEKGTLPERLAEIYKRLREVLEQYKPEEVAVEEVFVNVNPSSTLKLGQARGVAILTPSILGISVFEYSPNLIKKSVVGIGHATKEQIQMMVGVLLNKPKINSEHSGDALAMAICHAHNRKNGL
ncbi:MAG: crossover junction endodeoxyribonuclease RuvC [Alphaproteobacteria bacterium]|nr:crossover junction endodeoxyribonuclease RuvC [Alphaproteobacteria bacterium]